MKYSLFKNIIYVYRKAFHFNKKLKIILPVFIIASVLIPILGTLIPAFAIGIIEDEVNILSYLIWMGGISLVYAIFLFIRTYYNVILNASNSFVRIKEFFIEQAGKLMSTDYQNVEPYDKQLLSKKATYSLNSNWVGPEFLMKNTPTLIINLIGLIAYATLISVINYWIIGVLALMTVLNMLLSIYARNFEQKHKDEYSKYNKKIDYLYQNSTSLVNGKDVRIYKMETWFYKVFHTLIKKRVSWKIKTENRYFLPKLSDNILLFVRDILAYSMLVTMFINNEIAITTFVFYIGVISGFSNWLNELVTSYLNLKMANLGVNDYRTYDELKDVYNHEFGIDINTLKTPFSIEFKDVSFKYPGASEFAIDHVNLKLKPGEKLAIVGVNGAGKTTLVKLLSGFYYPTTGDILIGGVPIQYFKLEDYYKLLGVVFQDTQLLALTIAQNIACSKEFDSKRLWESLELAGLAEKVKSLKHQENTQLTKTLSNDGILLSGGQMQRLMLARALYKDAPIIILDEPTAALDPLAEAELYDKYNDLIKGKTSIFISHRLSSTKFCDRIVFFENGSIVEEGTHDELMKKDGKYANMFQIQSHYYQENIKKGDIK